MLNRVFIFLTCLILSACGANGQVQNLEVEDFMSMYQREANVILLDVRTDEEIAQGKIPGAEDLDYYVENFQEELEILQKQNPDATLMIYCRSGGRSASAANMATQMGFKRVVNLLGGYKAYQEEFKE